MPTLIEWTDETWNPITGCDRISPGCKRCYAKRLHDMRHKAHCWPDRLEIPLELTKHSRGARQCGPGARPFDLGWACRSL